jgi:hypothetical protein
MGCDIHLYVEKKEYGYGEDSNKFVWVSLDKWTEQGEYGNIYLDVNHKDMLYRDRNYNLFCALSGATLHRFNNVPKYLEPKGLPSDCSKLISDVIKHWEGDGHSHSYLTLKELKEFDWSDYGETCNVFKNNIFEKLENLKVSLTDEDIRIVFFFDN